MWRAFFLALGIYAVMLGVECLVIDKALLAGEKEQGSSLMPKFGEQRKEIEPPEWAPWSLLSGGSVVILYSFTLPKRQKA
jgi:hypothetical protein